MLPVPALCPSLVLERLYISRKQLSSCNLKIAICVQKYVIGRMRTPVGEAFSYRIPHRIRQIHCDSMKYDLMLHWITMNMAPYPVWKWAPYGSTHPPYYLHHYFFWYTETGTSSLYLSKSTSPCWRFSSQENYSKGTRKSSTQCDSCEDSHQLVICVQTRCVSLSLLFFMIQWFTYTTEDQFSDHTHVAAQPESIQRGFPVDRLIQMNKGK